MASRIFWVFIAGLALVTGMVLQDGDRIFSWGDHRGIDVGIDRAVDRTVDRVVDRAVDSGTGQMQIVGSNGREIDVPPEIKREMGEAVGRLVKAEADLAIIGIRDGSVEELQAARVRRDQARTDVETLKDRIEQQKDIAEEERGAVREQIQSQVQNDIRASVRDAVRN